jgi:hypothetical protein
MAESIKGKVISIDMHNGIDRFSLLEMLVASEGEFLREKNGATFNSRFNHMFAEYLFPSGEIAQKFADILESKNVPYTMNDAGPEHYSLNPNR